MTDEMPEQKADHDNVERQLAAERRGWVFEFLGAAGTPNAGQRITVAQGTLINVPEDDECKGQHFTGEGDDPLDELLDMLEQFDNEHGRS